MQLADDIIVLADGTVKAGTMPNNGTLNKALDANTVSISLSVGYYAGGTISITLEEKSVTPTKSVQTVTPTSGKVLSKVTVAAIPDNYIDTTDADATADQFLLGSSGYVKGAKVEGSMPDNGAVRLTFDPLTQSSVDIPAGYTSGGSVTLTDDLLNALKSI